MSANSWPLCDAEFMGIYDRNANRFADEDDPGSNDCETLLFFTEADKKKFGDFTSVKDLLAQIDEADKIAKENKYSVAPTIPADKDDDNSFIENDKFDRKGSNKITYDGFNSETVELFTHRNDNTDRPDSDRASKCWPSHDKVFKDRSYFPISERSQQILEEPCVIAGTKNIVITDGFFQLIDKSPNLPNNEADTAVETAESTENTNISPEMLELNINDQLPVVLSASSIDIEIYPDAAIPAVVETNIEIYPDAAIPPVVDTNSNSSCSTSKHHLSKPQTTTVNQSKKKCKKKSWTPLNIAIEPAAVRFGLPNEPFYSDQQMFCLKSRFLK